MLVYCSKPLAVLLALAMATVGCRGAARSPFGRLKSEPQTLVGIDATVGSQSSLTTTEQGAETDDAITQRIAAESRALSSGNTLSSNPELAKYATLPNDTAPYAPSMERERVSTSSTLRSTQGCTSGCCLH